MGCYIRSKNRGDFFVKNKLIEEVSPDRIREELFKLLASTNPYIGQSTKKGFLENFDVLKIGLTSSRQELFKKSDFRVLDWFNNRIINNVGGSI